MFMDMEAYVVDYVNVRKDIHVLFLENLPDGVFLELLEDYIIETCLYSQQFKRATLILKNQEKLSSRVNDSNLAHLIGRYSLQCKLAEIGEIGGLFVEGSSGIVIRILNMLADTKINIEYQILRPTGYSFLIKRRHSSRCLAKLTTELKIRDNIIVR